MRLVEPYHLMHYQGAWYLIAVQDQVLKSFRFSDIELVYQAEPQYFKVNPCIVDQILQNQDIWFGQEQKVVLEVQWSIAALFKKQNILPKQQILQEHSAGHLLLSCEVKHESQVMSLVQTWIPHIKIIEPQHYQQKIEKKLMQYMSL